MTVCKVITVRLIPLTPPPLSFYNTFKDEKLCIVSVYIAFWFQIQTIKHILEVLPATMGGKGGGGWLMHRGPYRRLPWLARGEGGGRTLFFLWWKLQRSWRTGYTDRDCSAASYCRLQPPKYCICTQPCITNQITYVEPGQYSCVPMPSLWAWKIRQKKGCVW